MAKERNVGRVKMTLSDEKYVLFDVVKDYMLAVLPTCKRSVNF